MHRLTVILMRGACPRFSVCLLGCRLPLGAATFQRVDCRERQASGSSGPPERSLVYPEEGRLECLEEVGWGDCTPPKKRKEERESSTPAGTWLALPPRKPARRKMGGPDDKWTGEWGLQVSVSGRNGHTSGPQATRKAACKVLLERAWPSRSAQDHGMQIVKSTL